MSPPVLGVGVAILVAVGLKLVAKATVELVVIATLELVVIAVAELVGATMVVLPVWDEVMYLTSSYNVTLYNDS